MSFAELADRFNKSDIAFQNLKEDIERETNVQYDLKLLMKALGTEYDILKTSWREVRQLPLEKRSSALLYNRLFIPDFYHLINFMPDFKFTGH